MPKKGHSDLSVLEAVHNLSHMAELDLNSSHTLPEEDPGERLHAMSWRDPQYDAFNRERVKETFTAILKYLQELAQKESSHLREDLIQRGIQALILLATEAAQKVDQCTEMFKKEHECATELKEYKELQHFYLTKFAQRFSTMRQQPEELWQNAWGKGEISKEGFLTDLDTLYRDREYELFYLHKEDKTPFFHRKLLRHMQWMGQFDVFLADASMDDPFLRVQLILDKNAHLAAKEILESTSSFIDAFYKEALKFKNVSFVADVHKALMALMLAANNRNLMQTAIGKFALNYYQDFHYYLREALHSIPSDTSHAFLHTTVRLIHILCSAFFLNIPSKIETLALIHTLLEKAEVGQKQTSSPLAVWNNLRTQDASMRQLLKRYPNGPLINTLKLLKEGEEMRGFDPIMQCSNLGQLYTLSTKNVHITCLSLASPTIQQSLKKAEIVDEFLGFLESSKERHLFINFQDRTSLLEHARSHALEALANKKKYAKNLFLATFPKNTDFYWQTADYANQDDAKHFKKAIYQQIQDAEECGFYFPAEIPKKLLLTFTTSATDTIHTLFFASKERLERKNRLDFIEIFYVLLTLKLMEESKPDTMSFTSKDAMDVSASASCELFAFLRMMNNSSSWTKQEIDMLLWLFYAPALCQRQRLIDASYFNRAISALSIVQAEAEAHFSKLKNTLSKLYKLAFFTQLKMQF